MVAVGITLSIALVVIVVAVLAFCAWLVARTGSADSLKYVPPILRALRDVVRLRQRR